jgi:hypothetical protein
MSEIGKFLECQMKRIAIAVLLAALPTLAIAQTVLKEEPARHALKSGQVVLVDDGSCPAGQIKELTGGKGEGAGSIRRTRRCVPKK